MTDARTHRVPERQQWRPCASCGALSANARGHGGLWYCNGRKDTCWDEYADKAEKFIQHLIDTEELLLLRLKYPGRYGNPDLGCGLVADDGIPDWLRAQWISDTHAAIARLEADLVKITSQQSRNRKANR